MKTILITGGTQGLGAELVKKLSNDDTEIIVADRNVTPFDEFKSGLGGKVEIHKVDVADIKQVNKFYEKLKNRKVDILLNNAGVFTTNSLENKDIYHRTDALNSNLLGTINIVEKFLPNLLKSNNPQLIFTISIAALLGFGGEVGEWSTYNASKWGVKGYMMDLKQRSELKKIRIGAIYPGGFESNIYENSGSEEGGQEHNCDWMMSTETVANAVLFMIKQPSDANVDEMVITKYFGGGK
jgi:uncharacterized oxidoreductase